MNDVEAAARTLARALWAKFKPLTAPQAVEASRAEHIELLSQESTWKTDDPSTVDLLYRGATGEADADRVIRAKAMKYVEMGKPLPLLLGLYVCNRLKLPKHRGRDGADGAIRKTYLGGIVYRVAQLYQNAGFVFWPTRNDATEPECAASIVAAETGIKEDTVKKAWTYFHNKVLPHAGGAVMMGGRPVETKTRGKN